MPDAMPGIAEAARVICHHIASKNIIIVFGDFDADGMMAATALAKAIETIGGRPTIFIPDRLAEGYGFTTPALHRCLAQNPDAKLIVTVDCGISQCEACDEATSRGVEVVITDHHSITETPPASASALVSTSLPGTPEPLKPLCGAGVAFKLAHQLARQTLSPEDGRELINQILPLVAIGTVADLVPLTGENRIIVSKGLEILNADDCGGNEGLRALKLASGIYGDATASNLSFAIAPRINAAGRVGKPSTAIELLTARSSSDARQLAATLETNNESRRSQETEAFLAAEDMVGASLLHESSSIVLFNEKWHPGIIGLVASRLVSKYRLPTVILTNGEGDIARGSARCPEHADLDIMMMIQSCAGHLIKYGGHRVAAGLSLEKANIDAFRGAFDDACKKGIGETDLRREMIIDDWLQPSEITEELDDFLKWLEPCGMSNPSPCLAVRGLTLKSDPKCFGKIKKDNWELVFCETSVRGLLFRHDAFPFKAGDKLDIVFAFSRDSHGDLQMILRDAAGVIQP